MESLYAVGAFIVGTVVGYILPGLSGDAKEAVLSDAIELADQSAKEMSEEAEEKAEEVLDEKEKME